MPSPKWLPLTRLWRCASRGSRSRCDAAQRTNSATAGSESAVALLHTCIQAATSQLRDITLHPSRIQSFHQQDSRPPSHFIFSFRLEKKGDRPIQSPSQAFTHRVHPAIASTSSPPPRLAKMSQHALSDQQAGPIPRSYRIPELDMQMLTKGSSSCYRSTMSSAR
jgi:hypothetical protein